MGRRTKLKGARAAEGARRATEAGLAAAASEGGRFSVQRKAAAVLRLLRGEEFDVVSRAIGVTAATLSAWREAFLAGGEANLTGREATAQDEEVQRLKGRSRSAGRERAPVAPAWAFA